MTFPTLAAAPTITREDGTVGVFDMDWPAGIVAGETLIAAIVLQGAQTIDAEPAGWTQISDQAGSTTLSMSTHYYKGLGSEAGTVQFGTTGTPEKLGYIFRIANARDPAVDSPTATDVDGNSTAPNPPSLTPSWGGRR